MLNKEEVIAQLAQQVTQSPDAPDGMLKLALEQLVHQVTTGKEPEKPVDWAFQVSQAVACRHGAC